MCTIIGDTLSGYSDDVGGRVHDVRRRIIHLIIGIVKTDHHLVFSSWALGVTHT